MAKTSPIHKSPKRAHSSGDMSLDQGVLDGVDAVVYAVDRDLRIVRTNASWDCFSEAGGPSRRAVTGTYLLDWFGGEERERWGVICRDLLSPGQNSAASYSQELSYHSGGEGRWWELIVRPFRRDSLQPAGLVFTCREISAHKAMQAAMQAAEAQHYDLMRHLPSVIYSAIPNPAKAFLFVTPQIEWLTGYSPDEFCNQDGLLKRLIYSADLPQVEQEWAAQRHNGEVRLSEYRIVHRNGSVRWVLDRALPVKDGMGQLLFLEGTLVDISDRRRLEDALRTSETKYRALVEQAREAIFVIAVDGQVLEANRRATELLGVSREELLSMNLGRLAPDHWLAPLLADLFAAVLVGEGGEPLAVSLPTIQGPIPAEISATRIQYDNDHAVVAIVRDTRARRAAEQELKRLAYVVRTISEFVILTDLAGRIVFMNEAAAAAWGCNQIDELQGQSWRALLKTDVAEHQDIIISTNSGDGWQGELPALRRDLSSFPLQVATSLIVDDDETPIAVVIIGRDITATKQAEEALHKRNSDLQALNAVASAISQSLDLERTLHEALAQTMRWTDLEFGAIYLMEAIGKTGKPVLRLRTAAGMSEVMTARVARRPLVGQGGDLSEPVFLKDAVAVARNAPTAASAGFNSLVSLPLLAGGNLLGVLILGGRSGRHFSAAEQQLLTAVGKQIGVSLENAQLHGETRRAAERLEEEVRLRTAELQVSEERYRDLVQHAPVGILSFGWDGVVQTCNLAGAQLLQTYPEELIGHSLKAYLPVETAWEQVLEGLLDRLRDRNETEEAQLEVVTNQGQRRTLAGAWRVQRGTQGELHVLQAVLRDITEPLRLQAAVSAAQARIASEKEKLDRVVQYIADGVVVIDQNGCVDRVNPAVLKIVGRGAIPAEIEAHSLADLAAQHQLWHVARALVERPDPVATMQVELPDSSASDLPLVVQARASKIYDSSERAAGTVLVLHDVSELAEIDRLKSQIVSNVSHELRTPLRAIRLYLHNLRTGYDGYSDERRKDLIGTVSEQANLLNDLIEQILVLSRLDAGGAVPHKDDEDVALLVHRIVTDLSAQAATRQVTVLEVLPKRPLFAELDSNMISQVLRNLIDNGIKYTGAGGHVTVTAKTLRGGKVSISISDTGMGVSPSDANHMFERFYRGRAETEGIPGTGLGLAIAKQMVEAHHGTLTFTSKVGQGSTFTIVLPVEDDEDG